MSTLETPYRVQFLRQAERLMRIFVDNTGVPKSTASRICGGNIGFMRQIKKHSVTVRKHDTFLENLSALWPADLEWPEDIPRPPADVADFEQLSQEDRDSVAARIRDFHTKAAEENQNG